jgi:single-strand DNA-binding protein
MNINSAVMMGRLTRDPELKKIGEVDLCSFRIASNRIVGKNKKEKSIFIDVDAWGPQAKVCEKFLRKGSRVAVSGTLCQDTWKGKDGEPNSKIYIEANDVAFLDPKEEGQGSSSAPEAPSAPRAAPVAPKTAAPKDDLGDDENLPF